MRGWEGGLGVAVYSGDVSGCEPDMHLYVVYIYIYAILMNPLGGASVFGPDEKESRCVPWESRCVPWERGPWCGHQSQPDACGQI